MAGIADVLRRLVHAQPADVVTHGEELAAIDEFEKQHAPNADVQPEVTVEEPAAGPLPPFAPASEMPAGDAPPAGE